MTVDVRYATTRKKRPSSSSLPFARRAPFTQQTHAAHPNTALTILLFPPLSSFSIPVLLPFETGTLTALPLPLLAGLTVESLPASLAPDGLISSGIGDGSLRPPPRGPWLDVFELECRRDREEWCERPECWLPPWRLVVPELALRSRSFPRLLRRLLLE